MSSQQRVDVCTFLDDRPVSLRQWLIIFLGFITLSVDGFDVTAMGFIAPALIDDWQVARHDLGPLMMSGLFGLAAGSMISGPLADRFGRKIVIVGSVAFFGLASLISAWAWDLHSLTVLRFITGIGLGAAMPNITTLIAEFAPKRCRSHMSTAIHCGFNTGAALGGLASDYLINFFGWRAVLVAGGILPICLTFILILLLPESARFLAQHQRYQERPRTMVNGFVAGLADSRTVFFNSEQQINEKSAVKSLFLPAYGFGTLMIWLTLFIGLFSVYLLASWLPLLVRDSGLTISQAVVIGAMFQMGGMVGNFCMGLAMDKWGQHRAIAMTILGGAIGAGVLALNEPSMAVLCPLVLVLGFTINGINPGCYALAAQFYPTRMRATGVSWATGIGRFGAITGAGIGAMMLSANWSFNQVFMFLPIPLLVGVWAVCAKRRHGLRVNAEQSSGG